MFIGYKYTFIGYDVYTFTYMNTKKTILSKLTGFVVYKIDTLYKYSYETSIECTLLLWSSYT